MSKRQHCAYCGEDMGEWTKYSQRDDTCGARECERYMRESYEAEREERHRQIDEEYNGY